MQKKHLTKLNTHSSINCCKTSNKRDLTQPVNHIFFCPIFAILWGLADPGQG